MKHKRAVIECFVEKDLIQGLDPGRSARALGGLDTLQAWCQYSVYLISD